MELGLTGKVAIVTGAAGGIGRELAKGLAAAGCRVALCDIDGDKVQSVTRELGAGHGRFVADLSGAAACFQLVDDVVREFGRLDILVNAAAILRRVSIEDVDEELWQQVVDTNLKSVFFLSRAACAVMRPRRRGRIINFSSQGAYTGGFAQSALYNMTKGGILTLTKSFARTYASDGITVNAVAPGMVDTDMMRLPERELQAIVGMVPLGRLAAPSEMTGSVLFLASEWGSYVTGATIDVTGGQLMR